MAGMGIPEDGVVFLQEPVWIAEVPLDHGPDVVG